jgi:hypothetical protein
MAQKEYLFGQEKAASKSAGRRIKKKKIRAQEMQWS